MDAVSSFVQRSFTFKINSKDYVLTEEVIDQCFDTVFNKLLEANYAKESNLNLWSESYQKWKNLASTGMYSWKLYGNRVAELTRTNAQGTPNALSGLDKEGNFVTKGNPNNPKNVARRMALINGLMTEEISALVPKVNE